METPSNSSKLVEHVWNHDLDVQQKWNLVVLMMYHVVPGQGLDSVQHGCENNIASTLNVSPQVVLKVWHEYVESVRNKDLWPNLELKRVGHCGRKCKLDTEVPREVLVEANKRTKYTGSFAQITNEITNIGQYALSTTSVYRYFMLRMNYKIRNSYLKPQLTHNHEINRVKFILKQLEQVPAGPNNTLIYR